MSLAISYHTDRDYPQVALIASGAALVLAAIYAFLRTGFGVDGQALFTVVGLSLFLLNFPAICSLDALRGRSRRPLDALCILGGIGISVLLADVAVPVIGRTIVPVLGILGLGLNLRTVLANRVGKTLRSSLLIGLFFGLLFGGVLWGSGFLNPLLIEDLALRGGSGHIDTMFHASVANMLRVHDVASAGLDGIPGFHYHIGSHWMFARWASLAGIRVIDFYSLGYPIVVGPLFIAALVWLIQSIRRVHAAGARIDASPAKDVIMWAAIFVALTGFLPRSAMNGVGVWASGPLLSESYGVALTLLFIFATLAVDWWGALSLETAPPSRRVSLTDAAMLLVVFPLGLSALGFAKISVMALALPAAGYAVLRLKELRRPLVFASLALCIVAFLLTANAVTVRGQNSGSLMMFSFMRYYLPSDWWPFVFSMQFLWSWIYIVVRLRDKCVHDWADLKNAIRSNTIVDVEIVVLLSVLGVLPGMVLAVGSDAFYFIDVQRWVSLALLLGYVPFIARTRSWLNTFRSKGWFGLDTPRLIALFVALPVVLNVAFTTLHFASAMFRTNLATRREVQVLAGHANPVSMLVGARRAVKETLKGRPAALGEFWASEPGTLFGSATMSAGMQKARGAALFSALSSLDTLPMTEKKRALLFIPQSEAKFWQILPDPKLCSYTAFIGPAVSGIAMVDAEPPVGCKLALGYGLAPYRDRLSPQVIGAGDLCARAAKLGFERVYALRREGTGFDVHECKSVPPR